MKNKSLVLCVLCFLLTVSLSHAVDQGPDENVSLNNLLNYSDLQEKGSESGRVEMNYFAKYNDIEKNEIDLKMEEVHFRDGYMIKSRQNNGRQNN